MGSRFVEIDPQNTIGGGLFNNPQPIPQWIQFIPGIVENVILNSNSIGYTSDRDINSILAASHVGDDLPGAGGSTARYYPLFRGMVDTPVKGDQVLLCTFAGIDYYLGPVNTQNLPNFNLDHLKAAGSDVMNIVKFISGEKIDDFSSIGLSENFKAVKFKRMKKYFNNDLDNVGNTDEMLESDFNDTLGDIHGDMMFEGRHGNSIRIGSRNKDPYVYISNRRFPDNSKEGVMDGTLISITSKGTLQQHFGGYVDLDTKKEWGGFVLASDSVDEPRRLIGGDLYNYDYNNNHLFQSSDKITINAKHDSLFLSSLNDIYLGAGGSVNIVSNKETTIESSNIFLGRQAKDKVEPLVLGQQLVFILSEAIDAMGKLFVGGIPGPGVSLPIEQTNSPGWIQLKNVQQKLSDILSEYHYIEENVTEK